jgi:alpha-galactosidase
VNTCYAELEGDELVLGNERICRRFRWNGGDLISVALEDVAAGVLWQLQGRLPDALLFPAADTAEAAAADGGKLSIVPADADARMPRRLLVTVETRMGELEIRRVYRLYDGCPAIACDLYLRGRLAWEEGAEPQVADPGQAVTTVPSRLDCLQFAEPHWRVEAVEFFDVSDHNNNLVSSATMLPYRREALLRGNLFFLQPLLATAGLFVLKEAPCSSVQLAYPGGDLACRTGEFSVLGSGVTTADLDARSWTRAYGVVVGVCPAGELGRLTAVRSYQEQIRVHRPGRDDMILMNTWGDRSQDRRMGAEFAMGELEAGTRLGVTHLQLDDGWQTGRSSNSAFGGGSLSGIWNDPCYWRPHPQRFPHGLEPVMAQGREAGIQVCLWFNPSKDDDYAHWRDDASTLIGLHRQHGISTFKIDGVQVPSKRAETRLRRMFDAVVEATGGEAVFNLDVTAGQRYGYHYFNEYGNIFLENRYTDAASYYPHWTLRNLWMLSRYVPPQNLQIEFLNIWRNADKYGSQDPLAPCHVPFDYCFAITMVAQPLAWFEATGLPGEAFSLTPLVQLYRQHQERIHAGRILPIGAEPCGTGWTGFQSVQESGGYLLVFREYSPAAQQRLNAWFEPGRQLKTTHIAGADATISACADDGGGVLVSLPDRHCFALYQYEYC